MDLRNFIHGAVKWSLIEVQIRHPWSFKAEPNRGEWCTSMELHWVQGAFLNGGKWCTSMELHGVHGADLHGGKWCTSMKLHRVHGANLHGGKWSSMYYTELTSMEVSDAPPWSSMGVHGADLHGGKWCTSMELDRVHGASSVCSKTDTQQATEIKIW